MLPRLEPVEHREPGWHEGRLWSRMGECDDAEGPDRLR
jgi:hypothetical protein